MVIGQVTRRTRQSFAVVTLPRGVTTRQGHAGQAPLGHPARSEAELPGQQWCVTHGEGDIRYGVRRARASTAANHASSSVSTVSAVDVATAWHMMDVISDEDNDSQQQQQQTAGPGLVEECSLASSSATTTCTAFVRKVGLIRILRRIYGYIVMITKVNGNIVWLKS